VGAVTGIALLIGLAYVSPSVWTAVPGLFVFGLGVGLMLTPSVNIVQSSFPESRQGEISGLSRSISNLGSSFGTAIAGTFPVANFPSHNYRAALIVLGAFGLAGPVAAWFLPAKVTPVTADDATMEAIARP